MTTIPRLREPRGMYGTTRASSRATAQSRSRSPERAVYVRRGDLLVRKCSSHAENKVEKNDIKRKSRLRFKRTSRTFMDRRGHISPHMYRV